MVQRSDPCPHVPAGAVRLPDCPHCGAPLYVLPGVDVRTLALPLLCPVCEGQLSN